MLQIKIETPASLRIQKARTSLILDHPFFGSLLFRLKGRECRSVKTMATDGVSLFYNPDFVETLNAATLAGTLAHEVMHPALHHHVRRSGRDPKRWNVACDFAINPLLIDAGLSLPDGVLIDNRFRGMSSEQIYNMLESESETEQDSGHEDQDDEPGGEESKDETSGGGDSNSHSAPITEGGIGQVLDAPQPDAPPPDEETPTIEEQAREWDVAVKQATTVARQAGKVPAGLHRTLEGAAEASVDWREMLRRLWSDTIPADYSWMRPNRRHVWAGLYLPGVIREGVGEIAIAVDCSGSVSQLIGYQTEDNIPHLFHFAQVLVTMNRQDARYATVGTPAKFWQGWRDAEDKDETISVCANRTLTAEERSAVFSGDFAAARPYFEAMVDEGERSVTGQDRTLYALCRPERLLDLVRRFNIFDGGVRKIARHQQYFGILRAVERVKQYDMEGRRKGGVIWHTQGSGKSLTMVMLGKALALDREIVNPRIVIVTDRDDLDKQIKNTFKACELEPVRATSGSHLLQLIQNKTPLITAIVNKFDTALRSAQYSDPDTNIFVLVDESHRTQAGKHGGYSQFAIKMRRLLPKACYLGFTGTPLLKGERKTLVSFGGLIHAYKIDEAVADEAVVPLLYEGRMVEQKISAEAIDKWFEKISQGLTDQQKADLKRKFSRISALSKTTQAIRAKAFDISEHYRMHWQGTPFKAQLVAPSKAAAVRFKEVLDEIGHVTSEIIISPPDDNEGNEEVDKESKDLVRKFWEQMMKRYKTEDEYNRQVIDAFMGSGDPEILIVVSKLLTGFDAPRNAVLYVCKPLREHNLLQAIARVNRLYEENGEDKQFGFILDYEGLLGELDSALTEYSAFQEYDGDDIDGTVHDVRGEIRKLRGVHDQLLDLFKSIKNKKDMEQYEQFLADEPTRQDFYLRLRAFSRCLHISLSSDKLLDIYSDGDVDRMKRDWKQFSELKRSVQLRYQEIVNIKEFEPKIQKLLDDHVVAMPAEVVVELVNINDPNALEAVVKETGVSPASKADRIASATRKVIYERMEADPAFYKRFSELLEDLCRKGEGSC